MKKQIIDCFNIFRNNYTDWNKYEQELMKPNSKDEWLYGYHRTMGNMQVIYDSNREVIARLKKALENLDDETAQTIYDELLKAYFEDYNDAELLIQISKGLLNHYRQNNDYSRLVMLYSIIQNYMLEVDNPEGNGRNTDISYLKEGMSFIDHYTELDASARYRIWIMYYNYIVRLTDFKVISLKEALDCYDMIMAFSERPEIVKLDAGCTELGNMKKYISETLYIGIWQVDEADQDTRKRLYEHIRKYLEGAEFEVKSLYELPSDLYAGHLYIKYFEKAVTMNEVYEQYLEYFIYKFQFIKGQSDFDREELIQCINAINYLARLARYVTNRNLVEKAIGVLVDFVQDRWIRNNYSNMETVNHMLGKVCASLLQYDITGVQHEKLVTQLIVQRDIHVYIHARITAEIASAIYRELTSQNIAFFDEVSGVPRNKWRDFLYYICMFHDIGEEKILGSVKCLRRPLFESEAARKSRHIAYASAVFKGEPKLSMYVDAIEGHHTYYNSAEENGYRRSKSDIAPFVDILAISVFIEEATNPYFDFEQKAKPLSAIIQELETEKNRRFNGELVDLITNDKILQRQLEKIVSSGRDDIIYDVYHNWEKIQFSQDEGSVLDEIIEQFEEYRKSHDQNVISSVLPGLEFLAKEAQSDEVRGKALYYLMLYNFINGQYFEGLAYEEECNRLLKATGNYEYLAKNIINLGRVALLRDNNDQALTHFLTALSVIKRTPGCETEENMIYLYIAGIYVVNHHYIKAAEYYNRCDANEFDLETRLNYLSMYGYCNVKLNNDEPIGKIKSELENVIAANPELGIFPQYVYLAVLSHKMGRNDDLNKYLDLAKEVKLTKDDVTYYSDEMLMYLEILSELRRYSLMLDTIDEYIKLVKDLPQYAHIYIKLANAKIKCMSYINNHFEYRECEDMISEAGRIGMQEQAKHLEELEETILGNIRMREEHDEFLSHKEILEESVKKAQDESEQKSRFLSSMSHEIRTPINAILGLNEMILRESSEEDVLKYAADINSAGKQLLGIINDVLDYSKIEAGKMEIVPQRYNLSELINDIKNMIEPKLSEKNLKFIINCNDSVPNVLFGDDLRIKQVLINLLSNAYKYTQTGFVKFGIDYEKKDEGSVTVKFSVEDSGIGLKPDQIAKLAVPFERFDLVQNRGVEGTGLGMSIVTRLLEQMDSRLVIESEYGKGSEFSFAIDQKVIEWRKLGKLNDARRKMMRSSAGSRKNNGKLYAPDARILVVDDNAVNLKVAGALLKRTGINVTCASSGRECLKLCEENIYHIILLDHMMPEMDGIETLKHIKEMDNPNASIPVIALTANVVEGAGDLYTREGFDDLLTKPISADKMEETISSYLPDYLLKEKE